MVPDPDDAERTARDDAPEDDADGTLPLGRRALLGAGLAGAGLVGAATLLDRGSDSSDGTNGATADTTRETTPVEGSEARTLAEQFAPTLYFGRREEWFPTDPRPYTSEVDGETVVDGFDAFDGYSAARAAADGLDPAPTVFYHVLQYTERLTVVQYWLYSAFDQFTTNFHWHDWELLQVFVDRESDEPVLYVASAHSRTVPNNEYVDPDATPAVISEVGSHSSALGMNESRDTFQRLPGDDLAADVTNGVVSVVSGDEGLPFAYGLPRDEGFRLPYAVPELDGEPVVEHPDLPNVSRDDLVSADLTVESFVDLATPPGDLPGRDLGPVFEADHREGVDADADERYALVPTSEVEDIAAFTGPQLSFEFYVPGFVEDAVAAHITTTSAPWTQPRYDDPLADVTDSSHREVIESRFDVDGGDQGATVVGRVREVQPVDDVSSGVTFSAPSVEAVARLASDPVAVPTFAGVAAFVDVDPGDHTLVVNGAGYAPYAQEVRVGDDGGDTTETAAPTDETTTPTDETTAPTDETTTPTETTAAGAEGATRTVLGSEGEIGLVPNEDAVKLKVDAADRGGARRVRVADDAAGQVFDAPPVETDGRAGVYVHRAGGYTVEVTDSRGETSVERVNPGPNQNAAEVAKARTGVSGITRFLVDFLTETREAVLRQLRRQGGPTMDGAGGDGTSPSTATPTPRTDTPTRQATTPPSSGEDEDGDDRPADATETTATGTPTRTSTPTGGAETTAEDRLRALLDEAVTAARTANDAARNDEPATAAEALRELRAVLETLSALVDRADAPQPASRIAARRVETADSRAARALSQLESA